MIVGGLTIAYFKHSDETTSDVKHGAITTLIMQMTLYRDNTFWPLEAITVEEFTPAMLSSEVTA
jgi:hypothetical protein